LFSKMVSDYSWADFLLTLSQDRDLKAWGEDLVMRVKLAACDEAHVPPLPAVRPANSRYAYCAVLCKKDDLMNGSMRFHVALASRLPGIKPDSDHVSDRVFSALSLTQQSHWLVLDTAREEIHVASKRGEEEQRRCMQDLLYNVGLVAREARTCRIFTGDQVAESFAGSAISPADVDVAIEVLREAIKEVKNRLDTPAGNASTRWEVFKSCVKRMKAACNFVTSALACRLSELNPQQAVPMREAHEKRCKLNRQI